MTTVTTVEVDRNRLNGANLEIMHNAFQMNINGAKAQIEQLEGSAQYRIMKPIVSILDRTSTFMLHMINDIKITEACCQRNELPAYTISLDEISRIEVNQLRYKGLLNTVEHMLEYIKSNESLVNDAGEDLREIVEKWYAEFAPEANDEITLSKERAELEEKHVKAYDDYLFQNHGIVIKPGCSGIREMKKNRMTSTYTCNYITS